MIGTTAALIGAAAIGAGSSLAAGAIGSKAAGKAADVQATAANDAARLQYQASQEATAANSAAARESLQFQRDALAQQQQNMAPWLDAGRGAILNLRDMMNPGGTLSQQWDRQFVAPTGLTMENDPGYQTRLKMGQEAIEGSASARGAMGGGTLKALTRYGQDYGSNEFEKVYARAKDEYSTAYNQFQQNQSNQFNRQAAIAGIGQTTAGELNSANANFANQAGNITTGTAGLNSNIGLQAAQNAGNNQQNAAAARASGYVGSANSWLSSFQNISNNLNSYLTLRSLGLVGGQQPAYAGADINM